MSKPISFVVPKNIENKYLKIVFLEENAIEILNFFTLEKLDQITTIEHLSEWCNEFKKEQNINEIYILLFEKWLHFRSVLKPCPDNFCPQIVKTFITHKQVKDKPVPKKETKKHIFFIKIKSKIAYIKIYRIQIYAIFTTLLLFISLSATAYFYLSIQKQNNTKYKIPESEISSLSPSPIPSFSPPSATPKPSAKPNNSPTKPPKNTPVQNNSNFAPSPQSKPNKQSGGSSNSNSGSTPSKPKPKPTPKPKPQPTPTSKPIPTPIQMPVVTPVPR